MSTYSSRVPFVGVWAVTPCSDVVEDQRFRVIFHLHHQGEVSGHWHCLHCSHSLSQPFCS